MHLVIALIIDPSWIKGKKERKVTCCRVNRNKHGRLFEWSENSQVSARPTLESCAAHRPTRRCHPVRTSSTDKTDPCMSCVSGPALPCSLQFQTRPAHPHGQEQESKVCAGVGPNQSYDTSRRCDCWWSWWNGTLPSSATPATGWRIYVYHTMYIHCIYHI